MKNKIIEVTIPEACTENWDEMGQCEGFRFCKACSKNVIDFSGYTNTEIINVLANAGSAVCGRMSQSQLNQLNYRLTIVPTKNRNWMKYLCVLAIGASVLNHNAEAAIVVKPVELFRTAYNPQKEKAEEPVILRKVYGFMFSSHNNVPIAGLKLRLKGTNLTAVTDKNGRYEFKINDNLYWKYNELIAEGSEYLVTFNLDYKVVKQKDYYPYKAEFTILGKIAVSYK
ncbi:carboxypeptidase-like regulatory domain-containing protein [Pedobacter suwonensis]|uniref:carboxypeptidase-like regulatory domain-containing protein n=1 Tax=Pedobacter suwonensis TaxID=332999 RepID=UPI0011A63E99|nr:carboxypeptidase-like regulatory domain-containing protein [Pedobacter suwonensis]